MRQRIRVVIAVIAGTVLASMPSRAQAPAATALPSAQSLIDGARAKAAASDRLVMIEFTASWCGSCRKYEKFLADSVAGVGKIMRDNFVVVPVVVLDEPAARNNPGSDVILSKYAEGKSTGIPFYVIMDPAGKVLGTSNAMPDGSNIGHPAIEAEFEAYDRLLAKAAPRITAAERLKIKEFLRAMAK